MSFIFIKKAGCISAIDFIGTAYAFIIYKLFIL